MVRIPGVSLKKIWATTASTSWIRDGGNDIEHFRAVLKEKATQLLISFGNTYPYVLPYMARVTETITPQKSGIKTPTQTQGNYERLRISQTYPKSIRGALDRRVQICSWRWSRSEYWIQLCIVRLDPSQQSFAYCLVELFYVSLAVVYS